MLLLFILFFSNGNPPTNFPIQPLTVNTRTDTTINSVQIKLNAVSNTWHIEWLKPIHRLRFVVTRIDGKVHMDQTFNDSVNGDFDLMYLTPGIYFMKVYRDKDLPFQFLLYQNDSPKPIDNG